MVGRKGKWNERNLILFSFVLLANRRSLAGNCKLQGNSLDSMIHRFPAVADPQQCMTGMAKANGV